MCSTDEMSAGEYKEIDGENIFKKDEKGGDIKDEKSLVRKVLKKVN